jgi:hypothetical protein
MILKEESMHRMLMSMLAILILMMAMPLFAAETLFRGNVDCYLSAEATELALGDFDGDGDRDLAALSEDFSQGIFILRTHTNGTFMQPTTVATGENPFSLAAGDLNGDGYDDLLVYAEEDYDDLLWVYINNQDVTFAAPVKYPCLNTLHDIVLHDVDGDSDLDVIAISYYDVTIFKNNGDGTLAAGVDYAAGGNQNNSVAVGDFDADTDPDLAVTTYGTDSLCIFLNDGTGVFGAPTRYYAGSGPTAIIADYINDDSYVDIAVAHWTATYISVMINDGDGTFAAPVNYNVSGNSWGLRGFDVDTDGDIDLATTTWTEQNSLKVLINDGTGVFGAPLVYDGYYSKEIVSDDFDKNGYPDLAVAHGDDLVQIIYNDGEGALQTIDNLPLTFEPHWVEVGDIEGDGDPDIVVASAAGDAVVTAVNNGDSSFTVGAPVACPSPYALDLANLDATPALEIIAADFSHDSLAVQYTGAGAFAKFASGNGPYAVVAAKINNDTYLDLVSVNNLANTISVLMNNGSGSFGAPVPYSVGPEPRGVTAADLDKDGDIDLAVANWFSYSPGRISILLNDGNGTLVTAPEAHSEAFPQSITTADVDDDNDLDLIVSCGSGLSVAFNNGNATFTEPDYYLDMGNATQAYANDFDLDGDIDIAVGFEYYRFSAVIMNKGDGTFGDPILYHVGNYNRSIAGGDLDDDGDVELVSIASSSSIIGNKDVVILWNREGQIPVAVDDPTASALPAQFSLLQNHPNPFNPATTIAYTLDARTHVVVTVYNLLGQAVATLVDVEQPAGNYEIVWGGQDDAGHDVASGVYFYQLRTDRGGEARKMLLLK